MCCCRNFDGSKCDFVCDLNSTHLSHSKSIIGDLVVGNLDDAHPSAEDAPYTLVESNKKKKDKEVLHDRDKATKPGRSAAPGPHLIVVPSEETTKRLQITHT